MNETNWLPGQVVFIVALVLAAAYVVINKRRDAAKAADRGTEDDLTARYNSLVAELKEHIANRHLLPPDAWEVEKTRLEQAAVAVLKRRDDARHEALKAEARAEKRQAAQANTGGGSTMKGALIGGAVVGFFVLLGVLLTDATKPRAEGMTATGVTPPGMPANAGAPEDTKLQPLFAAVQAHPDDVDALADLSLHLLRRQGFEDAKPFILRGTQLDPFHVRTRVARAVMAAVEGSVATAQDELERLGANYGEAYDANLFAGLIAMDQNDQRRAIDAFERYFAVAPPGDTPPMMRMAVEQMKQQVQQPRAP